MTSRRRTNESFNIAANWRGLLWICLLAATIAGVVTGCSAAARHKVLTVIFTGVPPLQQPEQDSESTDRTVSEADTAALARLQAAAAREPKFWVHGPYGAGQCDRCHALDTSRAFRDSKRQQEDPFTAGVAAVGSRLAALPEVLCISCHSAHNRETAEARDLRIHAPSASGQCTACHSPHQSQRRYMLLASNNRQLCSKCHEFNIVEQDDPHGPESSDDCLSCHNAHVGKSLNLLKTEQEEIHLIYGEV